MQEWANERRFLERVNNHTLKILQDDGVRRHLRFSNNGSSVDQFDLVTWPWHLCYTGDMGTYVFSRIEDMFGFFRDQPWRKGETIGINEDYWAEKVLAADKADGLIEFDEERFREVVRQCWKDIVGSAIRSGEMNKAESSELWRAMKDEILSRLEDGEIRACDAANEFEHEIRGKTYRLEEFWEHSFKQFTGRFVWACRAIAWGIKQYEAKKPAAVLVGNPADK